MAHQQSVRAVDRQQGPGDGHSAVRVRGLVRLLLANDDLGAGRVLNLRDVLPSTADQRPTFSAGQTAIDAIVQAQVVRVHVDGEVIEPSDRAAVVPSFSIPVAARRAAMVVAIAKPVADPRPAAAAAAAAAAASPAAAPLVVRSGGRQLIIEAVVGGRVAVGGTAVALAVALDIDPPAIDLVVGLPVQTSFDRSRVRERDEPEALRAPSCRV
mmetsp:Transcript_35590/g.115317  ORF Transcript_35590/g.115317 Transcript_35590/m.115317 type:complete len:212 (+) Transcript_35590:488-1123(+)